MPGANQQLGMGFSPSTVDRMLDHSKEALAKAKARSIVVPRLKPWVKEECARVMSKCEFYVQTMFPLVPIW